MELNEKGFFEQVAGNFPELRELAAVEQDAEFHGEGDVYTHTKLVCEALYKLKGWKDCTFQEQELLLYAAAFHDIGKRTCTRSLDGKIHSPHHAVKGAEQFRRLWLRCCDSGILPGHPEQKEQIAWLIRWHGLPQLFLDKENVELAIRRAAKTVSLRLLALLAEADFCGRICRDSKKQLERIEYFKEYTKELGCYERSSDFPNAYTEFKYLRGEVAWYGDCLYEPPGFSVFLMMGLPLSGKDTWLEKYAAKLPVISLDQIREEFSIRPEDNNGAVVMEAMERARCYLRKKEAFAWNATNLTRELRSKLCRLFEQYGARVTIINVEAPYQELLCRNQKRQRKVPEEVLERMLSKLEFPLPWEAYQVKTVWNAGTRQG